MSFSRDIAAGVAAQVFRRLLIFAAVVSALTALVVLGVPWVWDHVSISII
jgi:hypothetical protein